MTDRDALSLGIKVTGFAWLLYCVNAAHNAMNSLCFINMVYRGERIYSQAYPLRIIGYLAVSVVITICLLAFSDRLAKLVIKSEKELSVTTIFSVAVGLIGVIFASISVLLVYSSLMAALGIGENQAIRSVWITNNSWVMLVQTGVVLITGVFLAGWPDCIAGLIYNHKISEPGLNK